MSIFYAIHVLFLALTFHDTLYKYLQPAVDIPSAADLLFDLLHLKNNTGALPPQFVQDVDE
jgi:hypothetical protein